jgi:enamine deaminase RidA (YjgF/YER057c/UK114 family)
LTPGTAVWRRFFCSDIANQSAVLRARPFADPAAPEEPCAISHVGQPPLPWAKVALWACHLRDPRARLEKQLDAGTLCLRRGEVLHLWTPGMVRPGADSPYEQTRDIFASYTAMLRRRGLTLADHVVRTWLFQPYIDTGYRGMVEARREFFTAHGLTAETHYIASTGIAGRHERPDARVFMDAFAVGGLRANQLAFLTAEHRLGPTSAYGVTFERATAVSWADRKQVYVSGTASIDPQGNVVHEGDVVRQLDRTLGNIAGLLEQAGAGLEDMAVYLVYLRDASDQARVLPALRERVGDAPLAVLAAAVCRPGWLIEIEGIAVVPATSPGMPAY